MSRACVKRSRSHRDLPIGLPRQRQKCVGRPAADREHIDLLQEITKELNLIEILPPLQLPPAGRLDDENSGEYLGIQKKLPGRLLWH
jgi:hypothetical protein